MLSIVPNTDTSKIPCLDCPIAMDCHHYLDKNGERIPYIQISSTEQMFGNIDGKLNIAKVCKKSIPNFKVIETNQINSNTRYSVRSRGGQEIVSASSFVGMIGQMFLLVIGVFLVLGLIALICTSFG